MLSTEIKVLDNLLAINLNINLWSARKKLSFADFGDVDFPPEDLASLGSKKICDPEELKIFYTLKARAFNLLDKHGIRFLGGWAIPEHTADEIIAELVEIRKEFEVKKSAFLNNYDQAIQNWLNKHTDWSGIIANSVVSADYVSSRMNFAWQLYKVMPLIDHNNQQTMQESGLYEEIENLGNSMFNDIAKTAAETWNKVFANREEVTHKALSPLKTLHNKIKNLSFIDPHLLPVAELIETTLSQVNPRGNIKGTELLLLHGLLSLLKEPTLLLEQCKKIFIGESPKDIIEALCSKQEQMMPIEEPILVAQNQIASYGLW